LYCSTRLRAGGARHAFAAFDLRRKWARTRCLPLARGAFGVRWVNAANTSSTACITAGARNSERPFTRPQRRCGHHCGVGVPDLPLRSHAEILSRTRSIRNSPLGSVSRPTPGGFVIPNPLPAVNPALMRCHPASTPLWVFCTLRIEAFDRPHRTKLARPDVRLLLTLRRVSLSITLRID